uniref:Uncharacterized protein n=1 Tax=Propithecus coquereli TaxID=379532 RepID=A0A2K6F291_PROCO
MSGSRQAGSGSAGTSPGSSAASSVTSASSSLSSSPSPPSVAASAAALVSGGAAQAAGSGGGGAPVRPVGGGSGGGAVSAGLSRLSCAARPSAGVGGSSSSVGSGSRKRPLLAPLCNGLINSYEDKSNDFVCLFYFFPANSYKCIHQSLEDNNRCPKCNYVVDNIDHLYPNFLGITCSPTTDSYGIPQSCKKK